MPRGDREIVWCLTLSTVSLQNVETKHAWSQVNTFIISNTHKTGPYAEGISILLKSFWPGYPKFLVQNKYLILLCLVIPRPP